MVFERATEARLARHTAAITQRAIALVVTIGGIWAVSFYAFNHIEFLYALALIPRRTEALVGILGMPLVHDSLPHLLANTVPLAVLGALVLVRGVTYYVMVMLSIILLGGIALWLFGREAAHIGASGLVFGLLGFLAIRGVYDRGLSSAVIALVAVAAYGGMVWGILPHGDGVSWEAHLFGLVAGALAARFCVLLNGKSQDM